MKLTILLFLVTFVQVFGEHQLVKKITIKQTKPGNDLPENKMAKQCGGTGSLVQQRNALCSDPECKVKPEQLEEGKEIKMESEIIPSRDIVHLGYRIMLSIGGQPEKVMFDEKVPESSVVAGSSYTVQLILQPKKDIKGRVTGRYEIYNFADPAKTVDICVEVQFDFL